MISGTIYNAGKMLEMTQKWEQKKSSGNILKKEVKELSPEEQQLKMYQEQLEREREGNEYSSIYAKIQSGQELSPAEEDKLRAKDPKMYMEYKADRMEQEAYEKKLKNCKTKEEAERLHVNRMNGKLSELKSIVNNPNIPKSEKLKEAQRLLGDTTKTAQIFHTFTKSEEFKKLPTEEEVVETKQAEAEMHEEQIENVTNENAEVNSESDSEIEVVPDISEDKNITDSDGNTMKGTRQHSEAFETEKRVLEEMFELERKHFGESKKVVRIDVSL